MNFKKYKIMFWSAGILIALFVVYFLYQMTQSESINSIMTLIMLLLGLVLGGIIAFLVSNKMSAAPVVITESSHTIAESMRKVFKVVSAEGHFNEIYNYEETTKIFNFIPSKKKFFPAKSSVSNIRICSAATSGKCDFLAASITCCFPFF